MDEGQIVSKVFGPFDNLYDFLCSGKIWSNLQCKISKFSFETPFAYVYENIKMKRRSQET